MRIVIGVDWSDQSFAAVQAVARLYRPTEVALVHGVELGMFESPVLAQAANMQGYDEFRKALVDAGRDVLDRAAGMLPLVADAIRKINEIGSPAKIILDAADTLAADLIAVGARGRSRVAEAVLGSVSHRVLLHASRPTLIVKGSDGPVRRVLVAVEGKDDADRITRWLRLRPFADPVELCVLNVVVPVRLADPYNIVGFESWSNVTMAYAEDLVKTVATALKSPQYTVTTRVVAGEAAVTVAEQADGFDLVVTASHGRKGLERFLLGSVSHAIVHHVACPILVVR